LNINWHIVLFSAPVADAIFLFFLFVVHATNSITSPPWLQIALLPYMKILFPLLKSLLTITCPGKPKISEILIQLGLNIN